MKWVCPNCGKRHAEHSQAEVNHCFRKICEVGEMWGVKL